MNFKRAIFVLMVILCFGFVKVKTPDNHALYLSVLKIQHGKGADVADMHIRVFTDDLKNALRNEFGYESLSENGIFCSDYDTYLQQYFEKRITFTINEKAVKFKLDSCEETPEVYQLSFQMNCPKTWESVQIKADYFMELFPSQSNVLHLESGDTKRFDRMTKGDEALNFNFRSDF